MEAAGITHYGNPSYAAMKEFGRVIPSPSPKGLGCFHFLAGAGLYQIGEV